MHLLEPTLREAFSSHFCWTRCKETSDTCNCDLLLRALQLSRTLLSRAVCSSRHRRQTRRNRGKWVHALHVSDCNEVAFIGITRIALTLGSLTIHTKTPPRSHVSCAVVRISRQSPLITGSLHGYMFNFDYTVSGIGPLNSRSEIKHRRTSGNSWPVPDNATSFDAYAVCQS